MVVAQKLLVEGREKEREGERRIPASQSSWMKLNNLCEFPTSVPGIQGKLSLSSLPLSGSKCKSYLGNITHYSITNGYAFIYRIYPHFKTFRKEWDQSKKVCVGVKKAPESFLIWCFYKKIY